MEKSPLAGLPREVRDTIHRFTVVQDRDILLLIYPVRHAECRWWADTSDEEQIYEEKAVNDEDSSYDEESLHDEEPLHDEASSHSGQLLFDEEPSYDEESTYFPEPTYEIKLDDSDHPFDRHVKEDIIPNVRDALSSTRSCRQARIEAMPIFLAENKFRVSPNMFNVFSDGRHEATVARKDSCITEICRWISIFGTLARHIRHFTLSLDWYVNVAEQDYLFNAGVLINLMNEFNDMMERVESKGKLNLELNIDLCGPWLERFIPLYGMRCTIHGRNATELEKFFQEALQDEEAIIDHALEQYAVPRTADAVEKVKTALDHFRTRAGLLLTELRQASL